MAQRIARPVHLVVAWLLVVGLLVQVFLAGRGVFGSPANFATHRDFGFLLTVLPLILVVTALGGRFGRGHVIAAGVMFVQFILQSFLILAGDEVAALHPVNGFLILLIATWVARDALRHFGVRRGPAPAEAPAADSTEG